MEPRQKERWYTAELKYQQVVLARNFRIETFRLCKDFNSNVLGWFATFGGWALLKADFGASLSQSVWIENTATSQDKTWLKEQVNSFGFEFAGFSAGHTRATSDSTARNSNRMKKLSISEVRVRGYLPRKIGSCGSGASSTYYQTPEPVPVKYGLIPLWDDGIPLQTIPGLTHTEVVRVRSQLRTFVDRVQAGGVLCGTRFCSNRGVCRVNQGIYQSGAYWNAAESSPERYLKFWDSSKCICNHGYQGNRCQTRALLEDGVTLDLDMASNLARVAGGVETVWWIVIAAVSFVLMMTTAAVATRTSMGKKLKAVCAKSKTGVLYDSFN